MNKSDPVCVCVCDSDVDECVDSAGTVCGSQRCENTIGSFRCFITCEPGYSLTATGECVGKTKHAHTTHTTEFTELQMFAAFRQTLFFCLSDINECANESVCGRHMFCRNLIGTYQCICDQGYETARDGRSCVGVSHTHTHFCKSSAHLCTCRFSSVIFIITCN